MSNPYLAAAYAFVWVTFIIYDWSLVRRRARLSRELDELKNRVEDSRTSAASE